MALDDQTFGEPVSFNARQRDLIRVTALDDGRTRGDHDVVNGPTNDRENTELEILDPIEPDTDLTATRPRPASRLSKQTAKVVVLGVVIATLVVAGGVVTLVTHHRSSPGVRRTGASTPLTGTSPSALVAAPLPSTVAFTDRNHGLGLTFGCSVSATKDPVCDFAILASHDAGRTWTRVGGIRHVVYAGWRGYPDIELAVSGTNVWVYGTRTFASHDGGRTFRDQHFNGLVSALVPTGDRVWAALQGCGLCPTDTLLSASLTGGPWTTLTRIPDLGDPNVDLVRPTATVAYVGGSYTHTVLYRSGDAGRSWQTRALPPPPPSSSRSNTVTLAALGSNQLWILTGGDAPGRTQQKALYRSDDTGLHWTLVADTSSSPRPGVGHLPFRGLGLRLTVATPQRIWIPLDEGPFIGSLDGGQHWLDTRVATHIEQVLFIDPLHGWTWNGGGYHTTDGKHWNAITQ